MCLFSSDIFAPRITLVGLPIVVSLPILTSCSSVTSHTITEQEFIDAIKYCKKQDSDLHIFGLLSDGGVHSHINHLLAMIEEAKAEGINRVRVHVLLDGRDVPATSALTYVEQLEKFEFAAWSRKEKWI